MYCIAIDLGGTIIKIGLVKGAEILEFNSFPAKAGSLADNLPVMKTVIDRLLGKWRVSKEELSGIGLAFPGMVNPKEKRVTSTNDKYDDACDIDLASWVYRNWETLFIIDNDARLALAGEWCFGAGRNSRNMVMMTIGTGIGTGVVLDGKELIIRQGRWADTSSWTIVDGVVLVETSGVWKQWLLPFSCRRLSVPIPRSAMSIRRKLLLTTLKPCSV